MRPWQLRALVLTGVFGLGQAGFVALRSVLPDQAAVWSVLLLGVLVLVGVLWSGAEVVLGRRPPEWTWFGAALVTGPASGVLSWALVALFVDASGTEDLGSALVGRAAFTALVVLASSIVGSWWGRVALRRRGERDDGERDGGEPVPDESSSPDESSLPDSSLPEGPLPEGPLPEGSSSEGSSSDSPAPEALVADRSSAAPSASVGAAADGSGDDDRVPDERLVVAVIPTTDLATRPTPSAPSPPADGPGEPDHSRPRTRRSGLRRPR